MLIPKLMRRPHNIISMPSVVERVPIEHPGFAVGDPRHKVPSLVKSFDRDLLPFSRSSLSFVAPWPSPGKKTSELLARLELLPNRMPIALFESETPLWPNYLVPIEKGTHLQAVRSSLRNQGKGYAEAWCVLSNKLMKRLLRGKEICWFRSSPHVNRRFLNTALDFQRTLMLLNDSQSWQSAERVCVVMPHFDDEVLQCGGAIAQAIRAGSKVRVIWLSDGSRGVDGVDHDHATQIRQKEARKAMSALGVTDMHFLNGVETKLAANSNICESLNKLLNDFKPQRVHTVWWGDNHVDHFEANRILYKAWPRNLSGMIAASSLWQPMPRRTVVPLDAAEHSLKLLAVDCYKSQIAAVDYLRLSQNLDSYFSKKEEENFSENFWYVPVQQYFSAMQQSKVFRRLWV